jgi:cyclopropane fatty-acyl-phospholipid synthase-like methyltransferase
MIKVMSNYLRPGNSVLDAGCGSGFFSSYFISCGCDVYSLDYSEQALSIAKSITRSKSKAYIKGNMLDERTLLDIGRRFDIIFTDGLLEHYPEKEQDRIIQNLKALKKEKGLIINFVPNRFSFWSIIRPFYIDIKERPFLISEFLDLHTRNGLEICLYGGINVTPFRISPERLLGRYIGMLFHCVAV